MQMTFRTLTPIWTGDANMHADQTLQTTGLLGSMRWWYEVLVRGVGGRACEATGQNKCILDPKKLPATLPNDPAALREVLHAAGLCDVCQVFGATNWRRRFRLAADQTQLEATKGLRRKLEANRRYQRASDNRQMTPTWYFNSEALVGKFTLTLTPLGAPDVTPIMAGLLQFIADWAMLGAKVQTGMGVVQVAQRQDRQALYDQLARIAGATPPSTYADLPNLTNIFLSRFDSPENELTAVANLRYDLRRLFAANNATRHGLFGYVQGNARRGSKIKVSAPYTVPRKGDKAIVMRVWGWAAEQDQRAASFGRIHSHLQGGYRNIIWREFNSPRSGAKHHYSDPLAFAADLLEVTP